MNQAIQFQGDIEFDATKQAWYFTALVMGMSLRVLIPFSEALNSAQQDETLWATLRFDWEEMASELIAEEAWNEFGEVWLT